ncbi:DUF2628 domain-containing protein [Paenibacillus polymyxa]|uniref:DUF2628 domain-containing protein n=1 Tax=Paenibacillus polymyxa TaxID=1406 RepID=UPI00211D264C|nr:DUF2628 domain-containing protein [Paenibacillus polymyxa]
MTEINSIIADDDIRTFTGKEYYVKARYKIKKWNWAAFFFSYFWLLYRKMYLFGFSYLLFAYLIDFFLPESYINLMIGIVLGFTGNYIYLKFIEKKIQHISSIELDESARVSLLLKRGRTNLWVPILVAVLVIVQITVELLNNPDF